MEARDRAWRHPRSCSMPFAPMRVAAHRATMSLRGERTSRDDEAALTALDLRDEEHLGARRDRLEVAGLVDRAVDRDGGLLLQVLAQTGEQPVHLPDNAAEVLRLDLELRHAAGV